MRRLRLVAFIQRTLLLLMKVQLKILRNTYLYRIFKLKEGCTPAEWREKMTENVAAEDKMQD